MSLTSPLFLTQLLKRHWLVTVSLTVLLTAGVIFLQKVVLTRILGVTLSLLAASMDWEIHWKHLEIGLFLPLTMQEIQIRTLSAGSDETSFRASQLVLEFSPLWNWFRGRERLLDHFKIKGLTGTVDFRSSKFPFFLKDKIRYPLMIIPLALEIQAPDINLLFDRATYRLRNFSAHVREDSLGAIEYSFAQLETSVFHKNFPASSALATWKSGIFSLIQWPLLPDCSIAWINIHLLNPEGLGIDFDMAAFHGMVKGSLTRKVHTVPAHWDAALVAQHIELATLAKVLEISTPVRGVLKEGKFIFRGTPNDIAHAEASVQVSAEGFHWNDLGWQTLEFGADLIDQRVAIPEFQLRQKGNFLYFKGSASIPKNLSDFSQTPFEVSVLGDVQDLAALAGLLGPRFQHLRGRMTLDGSLSSGSDGLNGYFKLEASPIRFRDAQFTSARIDTVFCNGNAEIISCEIWNGKDFFSGHGHIDLNASHPYSGEGILRVQDIGSYRSLLGESWQKKFHSGAIQFTWQGDGTFHHHSGAFDFKMENLVSSWTQRGVNGHWEGTFSPGYLSFNRFELFRDTLRFTSQMSASPLGFKINHFQITKGKGKKPKAIGSGFLPVDLFTLISGDSWGNVLHSEKPIYLECNAEELELADFCYLIGQKPSLSGLIQLRLAMSGQASTLKLKGQFAAKKLRGKWNDHPIPSSTIQMKMEATQGTAHLAASLVSQKIGEIRAHTFLPLNSEKTFANLLNFSRPFQGTLKIEKLDAAMLRFFFPGIPQLSGEAKANLSFENTLSHPKVNGQMVLSDGRWRILPQLPIFSGMQVEASILENRLSLNHCAGRLGAGKFSIQGGIDFSQGMDPQINLQLTGDQLLLYQDSALTLTGNVHLQMEGCRDSGKVSGTIRLGNSELRRHIEMISPSHCMAGENFFSWENKIPVGWPSWGLDISIAQGGDFLVKAKLTQGEIIPRLHLGGNLKNVLPSGSIEFKNLRAFFPFAIADIPRGMILFDPQTPHDPLLDAQAFVDTAGAVLEIIAAGSLHHPRFFFTSKPPLSPQSISLFLLTGLSPWQENINISSSVSHMVFPLQMLRVLNQNKEHLLGAALQEETKLSFRDASDEFPGMSWDYGFHLK